MTPQHRAKRSAWATWSQDRASKRMGTSQASVVQGAAVITLTVRHHHHDRHGIREKGTTYSLTNSTFACNSRIHANAAQSNHITFPAPARLGDTLSATAREVSLTGRSGIYDVLISNQNDNTVAQRRGLSRPIQGHLFEE